MTPARAAERGPHRLVFGASRAILLADCGKGSSGHRRGAAMISRRLNGAVPWRRDRA